MTKRYGLPAATDLSSVVALSMPLGALAQSAAPAPPTAAPQSDVTHDMAVEWSRIVSLSSVTRQFQAAGLR